MSLLKSVAIQIVLLSDFDYHESSYHQSHHDHRPAPPFDDRSYEPYLPQRWSYHNQYDKYDKFNEKDKIKNHYWSYGTNYNPQDFEKRNYYLPPSTESNKNWGQYGGSYGNGGLNLEYNGYGHSQNFDFWGLNKYEEKNTIMVVEVAAIYHYLRYQAVETIYHQDHRYLMEIIYHLDHLQIKTKALIYPQDNLLEVICQKIACKPHINLLKNYINRQVTFQWMIKIMVITMPYFQRNHGIHITTIFLKMVI